MFSEKQKIDKIQIDRKRKPISDEIKKKIENSVLNMPNSNFCKKNFNNKYFFSDLDKKIELPHIEYDIPIIEVDTKLLKTWNKTNYLSVSEPEKYMGQNFEIINNSCMGVDKDTNRILWIFIKSQDDPAIKYTMMDAIDVGKGMQKYLKKKVKFFYSNFHNGWGNATEKRKYNYSGENWLDGFQRYLCRYKPDKNSCNFVSNYPMKQNDDIDWKYKQLRLYSLLYQLEKRYCPASAKYRYNLAKNVNFTGLDPNLPLELNPSTSIGGSVNFASRLHTDSSVKGTLESIIWTPATNGKQIFVNGAGYYFDINDYCLMFQVGTDYHGTGATGNHGGYGFVNLTKKNLVSDTKYIKDWYNEWNEYYNLKKK